MVHTVGETCFMKIVRLMGVEGNIDISADPERGVFVIELGPASGERPYPPRYEGGTIFAVVDTAYAAEVKAGRIQA